MTALDKMKGGVLLRSSLKTIWSSISIHGVEAAWNKCSPMNKIKTGLDSLRRRRVAGGCWELAGLPQPWFLVDRWDPFKALHVHFNRAIYRCQQLPITVPFSQSHPPSDFGEWTQHRHLLCSSHHQDVYSVWELPPASCWLEAPFYVLILTLTFGVLAGICPYKF